jgi:KaiC/GvpD/RAD55 family RecA-like ATPase
MERKKVEDVLGKARELEKEYNWVMATDLHKQALRRLRKKDFWKAGEIGERIAYCLWRAAFQAETREEFWRRMELSVEAYEEAAKLFERSEDSEKRTRTNFCRAMATYNKSRLVGGTERKALLDESWKLEKETLRAFEEAGDRLGQGKLCNELLYCLYDRSRIEWDRQQLNKIVEEAVGCGETAIEALSEVKDEQELARAYSMTSLHCHYGANISELEEKTKEFSQKCLSYSQKALELSEKVGDSYLIGLSNWAAARAFHFSGNMASSLEHAEGMLQKGMTIQDNYMVGVARYRLASTTNWMMDVEEDPDKKREGYNKAIRYAEDAIRHLHIVANDYFIALTPLAGNYFSLACEFEANREERRVFLERAVEAGRKSLEHAERSGSPDAIGANLHELSKALYSLSNVKTKISEKKKLLEEASKHRQGCTNIVERLYPSNYWLRGVGQNYQALIRAESAKTEPKKKRKRELLEEAASNMDNCLKLIEEWARLYPQTRIFAVLGKYYDWFGGILNQLWWLTEDEKILKDAIEAYGRAADTYNKAELPSRLAEAHWNIAKLYDHLGEYVKASENFESAAEAYKTSAEKIQRLDDFYSDYATYMQAWSEIEKAKLAHEREEYTGSEEHYNKTANYLRSSTLWNYLAPNYSAWALLEHAEHLSRQDKNQASTQVFQQAAEMFKEAKKSLETAWGKIVDPHEKEKVSELSRACDQRREYCIGRVRVEEARVFDREGDYEPCAKRYGLAAKAFEKVLEGMEIESDQRELQSIVYLCQAWQKMKLAEERLDPTLYAEASQLFMKAKESSLKKRTSLLAAGNSYFCKALELGARFKDTRNMKFYSKTKQYMESAFDCYTEAGFKKESFWINATQALFDSYVYMGKAETEVDLEKKLRLYLLAEKFLDRSANLFEKAGYLRKRNEVLRSIENVKQKREFMLSLREVLSTPSIASSTSSISTPGPTHEEAVGLERFEQAYVQANLVISPKRANVGEDLGLEIELVNTGKEPASLAKVEGILPPGFEPVAKPDYCRFEDAYIDMKGKKLDPLKTEEVRIVLRSFDKGTFAIKPRIVYVDETGHQMFCEPEPVTINVSEVILPGRIITGHRNLDNLLFGGIPENYAVILTSPSCDERDLLIKTFLETGARQGEVTFHVTIDASGVRTLAEEFQSNFYLFICNPQADKMIESLPNVFKLKGVENLTEISISLTSAFRRLDKKQKGPRRACIEIISDILLQHHAVSARRWLTGLIPELRSKRFTTLTVINPHMHASQEVQAILDLFEGEINICEKETEKGLQKFLKIRKMYDQRYLESELPLRKERLET